MTTVSQNPLIRGFVAAVHPQEIDTAQSVTVPSKLSIPEATELGERYGVKSRSIYRWKALGVDVRNPLAVADFLLQEKQPSTRAIRSALRILESNKSNQ